MKRPLLAILMVTLVAALSYAAFWTYDYFSVGSPLGITLTPAQPQITDDQPIRILAFGDSGDGSSGQSELAVKMAEEEFDLVLHLGDLVYPRGSYDDFQANVLDIYDQKILDVMWPVMGNHDYASEAGAPYLDLFNLPENSTRTDDFERYYSVDIGRLHLVALDTNRSLDEISDEWDDDMADWFRRDLESVGNDKVVIVFFHHVAFSVGKHSPIGIVQTELLPIIDEFNVPLVLNGHDHNYQRTCPMVFSETANQCVDSGTTYIVSGGGSDNLYGLDDVIPDYFQKTQVVSHYVNITLQPDNSFVIEAVDTGDNIIDSFTIASR